MERPAPACTCRQPISSTAGSAKWSSVRSGLSSVYAHSKRPRDNRSIRASQLRICQLRLLARCGNSQPCPSHTSWPVLTLDLDRHGHDGGVCVAACRVKDTWGGQTSCQNAQTPSHCDSLVLPVSSEEAVCQVSMRLKVEVDFDSQILCLAWLA